MHREEMLIFTFRPGKVVQEYIQKGSPCRNLYLKNVQLIKRKAFSVHINVNKCANCVYKGGFDDRGGKNNQF